MPAQSTEFIFNAITRSETGKANARRLRRADKVPAVVYGADKKPEALTLEHKDVLKSLSHEAVYSHILTLNVDGKAQKVVLKALERHMTKPRIMHIDFLRIKAGEKITMNVPLHFIGEEECPGVKAGGVVSHLVNDLEIKCLPDKLPEFIEVNVSNLEMDQSIHLADIKLPAGVELTQELDEEHNPTLVSIHQPRVEEEPEEEVAEEAAEGEAAAGGETAEGDKAEGSSEEADKDKPKE